MKKSVLMSAAKKAQITLAVMAVCGMSFVNMGKVFAYEAGNNDISQATGNTVTVGEGNTVTGVSDNTVVGINNNISKIGKSNVFGYGNVVDGYYGSDVFINAFGSNNSAKGSKTSAFGINNKVDGENSSAFGYENTASGLQSSAFGHGNTASGMYSLAFGYNNTASGSYSSAFGRDNKLDGNSSLAFGYNNKASGARSSVFGYQNSAEGEDSFAFGYNNTVSKIQSFAFGYKNTASGAYSSVFGINNQAIEKNTLAFGYGNIANGEFSTAFGRNNRSSVYGSVVFGVQNTAQGNSSEYTPSSAFGINNLVEEKESSAFGYNNTATRIQSSAFGHSNTASGAYSSAFGHKNTVSGAYSSAFGHNNKVTKDNAIAIGIGAVADESNTISFGNAQDTTKNMRLVNIVDGKANTDAATYGQIITAIKKSTDGSKLEFYTGQAQATAKWSVDLAAGGGSLTQDEFNRMLDANSAFKDLQTDVSNKANIKGDNITTGADSKWAEKLGTGAIENGNKDLVTGGTVYDKLGAAESGNYIKDNNTVNANLKVLDEQVKTNTDAIAVNKNNIGDINNLTNAGLTSNNLSDAVVEVNNKVGTSSEMKELKDAGLGDNLAQATAAVNKKAEANKAAVERLDSRVDGLSDRVDTIGSTVNKLDSKVNKVGAGAAALAALHPLDFDPDNKLTFSAGVGNYRGENAAAIGAFYRPDEKVMFSIAGNMGNGENMLNAGITFALDRTTKTTTSKAAMARKIAEQEDRIAAQDAEIAQQKNDIAELKAIVAQLSAKVK